LKNKKITLQVTNNAISVVEMPADIVLEIIEVKEGKVIVETFSHGGKVGSYKILERK